LRGWIVDRELRIENRELRIERVDSGWRAVNVERE
jgi:hypothetical protein